MQGHWKIVYLFFLLREIEGTIFCPYVINDSMKLADVEIIVHVLY